MKETAIIFTSKYRTTEKIAHLLAEKLGSKVTLISLDKDKNPDITSYKTVILGTSIYAGKPRKTMAKFCEKNQDVFLQKTIGLFICGMQPDADSRNTEIVNAYPELLREHATSIGFLGGEFLFEKLNFFEKLIVKKVSKTTSSVSSIDEHAISEFANGIML